MKNNHAEGVRKQFGLRASTFDGSANWITDRSLVEAHADIAGNPAEGKDRALEICCGTGIVGRSLAAKGWSVTGVDITPEMAAEAGRHFPAVVGDAGSLPMDDASFDLAALRQSFFLLPDGGRALSEIRRVLRPGGRFILSQTVPFSGADAPWLEKIHAAKQSRLVRFYTAEDLEAELRAGGFAVRAIRSLRVRENITHWLSCAPELSPEKRAEVSGLIADSPPEYREVHRVYMESDAVCEDWNWVIFEAYLRRQSNLRRFR